MININYECDQCQHFNQFNIIKKQELECNECKNNYGTIDLDWDRARGFIAVEVIDALGAGGKSEKSTYTLKS